MPYPHTIRLRGPWEFEVLQADSQVPSPSGPQRAKMPCSWAESLGEEFRGSVRYRRKFNRPAHLDLHERLRLVADGADAFAEVTVNGTTLGKIDGYVLPNIFDVTSLIEMRNEVMVDVSLPAETSGVQRPGREQFAGGLIGEVRLEIGSVGAITNLSVIGLFRERQPYLHIAGDLIGDHDGPIQDWSIEVWANRRKLLSGPLEFDQAFTFEIPMKDATRWQPGISHLQPLGRLVQVVLLGDGEPLWQEDRSISYCHVEHEANSRLLVANDVDILLPVPNVELPDCEPTGALFGEKFGSQASTAIASRRILPNSYYFAFDQTGIPVLQYVPLEWAERVCPQLGSHPCIVAWLTEEESSPERTVGRPWLSCAKAVRAQP